MTDVETEPNVESSMLKNSSLPSISDNDPTIHELNDLLKRPTTIGTATLTQDMSPMVYGHVAGAKPEDLGLIAAYPFPSSIITKNPVVKSKVKQFSLIKAGMSIDIKTNSPSTINGCMMAVYIPINYGQPIDMSNLTVQAMTSYPCKILDYSTATNMKIELPYINEYEYHNMHQATNIDGIAEVLPGDYAYVVLWNLITPHSGTSADKVSVNVLASFNDVELKLPAEDVSDGVMYDSKAANLFTAGFVAQSDCNVTSKEVYDIGFMEQSDHEILETNKTAGVRKTGTEDRDSRNDPSLYTRIPGRDLMSGKDFNSSVPMAYSMIKHDGSKSLYDKKDEMSLNYILGRENIIGRIDYVAGKGPGTDSYLGKVRCFPKRPQMMDLMNLPSQMGTFDYTCNLFARYRGSINIGIQLVKTNFHYGRILVVLDPFDRLEDKDSDNMGTLMATNYTMSIDLKGRDGVEGSSDYYKFVVPYLNNAPYTSIGNDTFDVNATAGHIKSRVSAGSERAIAVAQECYNPYLRFYAFTELGHIEAASSVVPILVSISGGEDFELSLPTVSVVSSPGPTILQRGLYCQSDFEVDKDDELRKKLEDEKQSMKNYSYVLEEEELFDVGYLAQSDLQFVGSGGDSNTASMCVGEKITSLRELANRFTAPQVGHKLVPACLDVVRAAVEGGSTSTVTYADPFPGGVTLSLHTNTPEGFKLSNLEAVANLFRYTYGPRRYKAMANEPSTIIARLIRCPDFTGYANNTTLQLGATATVPSDWTAVYPVSPVSSNSTEVAGSMIVSSTVNNFLEVKRPFYSNTKLVVTRGPRTNPEDVYVGRDTVLLNLVAIPHKATKTYRRVVGSTVNKTTVESCYIQCIDGAADMKLTTRSDRSMDGTKDVNLNYDPELSFSERSYSINTVPETERAFTYTRYSTCHVVEALDEGAGFTFLQAPTCVIFG